MYFTKMSFLLVNINKVEFGRKTCIFVSKISQKLCRNHSMKMYNLLTQIYLRGNQK